MNRTEKLVEDLESMMMDLTEGQIHLLLQLTEETENPYELLYEALVCSKPEVLYNYIHNK